MNILVTGGAGFIGSHIVNAYVKEGHNVTIIDNLSSGESQFLNQEARFYEMDFLDNRVPGIMKKEKINVINHHAAQISVSDSVKNPLFDANSNIIGTLQLAKSAVPLGIEKFVFASTGGALYGEQVNFPAGETHPCRPLSPYGISKQSAENYLRFFNEQYGLSTTILRYSNVFGPHQNPFGEAGVVAIFCQKLVENKGLVIYGDGEQTRDFISVRDIVRANLIALNPACIGIFNVGTGKETTINSLANSLLMISGKNISSTHESNRNGEQRRSAIDYKNFYDQFGWKPEVSLEQGLIETYNFFQNQTS